MFYPRDRWRRRRNTHWRWSMISWHTVADVGLDFQLRNLEQKFFKNNPLRILVLCGHAGGLGLAVEPEKWKKMRGWKWEGVLQSDRKKSEFGQGTPEMRELGLFPIRFQYPLSFSNSIFFHFSGSTAKPRPPAWPRRPGLKS